jgi:addiction module RelE/StbE family toxin
VKVRWTDRALQHLRSAHDYVELENPAAAAQMMDRIVSAVEMLVRFPGMGRMGRAEGSRELVVTGTPFVVAYRVKRDQLQVLAVLHGARNWPDIL